jgi:hypothetical protein
MKTDEHATVFGKTSKSLTKVERYGWTFKDKPGRLTNIYKHLLLVDDSYQRSASPAKVKKIASEWSWVACSVIVVAQRASGEFFVIDGQHRVIAAKQRSDISDLPCVVFEIDDIADEARGFLNVNTERKPMASIGKFKASIAASDPLAVFVNDTLVGLDIKIRNDSKTPMSVKSLALLMHIANQDKQAFKVTMEVCAKLCSNHPIQEMLVHGLFYLHTNGVDLSGKEIRQRMNSVGVTALLDGSKRAAAFFARGGAKVFATGMLEAINKGLRKRYKLTD